MIPFATLFALAQALGFKTQELTERRLQEHGVSPFRVFALQRYARDCTWVLLAPLLEGDAEILGKQRIIAAASWCAMDAA